MQEQLHFGFTAPWSSPAIEGLCLRTGNQTIRLNYLKFLQKKFRKPLELAFTQNRSTMLSFKEGKNVYKLRLHELFLEASNAEIRALADYLQTHNKVSGEIIDAFIAKIAQKLPPKYTTRRVKGRFFNLEKLFSELNQEHFHQQCSAKITWGKAQRKRHRKSIQLGLYYYDENIIVIHPALDQSFVPEHYISWVIYHEMLHEILGCEKSKSKRRLHPPEFVALEESFPTFAISKQWEENNLYRLLKYKPKS